MNPEIHRLNKRLGETLGLVASGTLPRFAWKHSTEMPMVAERIGERWLLTEWRRPSMSHAEWMKNSGGRFPYPSAGWYHPYYETALPVGLEPSGDLTQKAIFQFDRQMQQSFEAQLRAVNQELEEENGFVMDPNGNYRRLSVAEDMSRERKEWVDYIQDSGEAFCDPIKGKTAFPQFMGTKTASPEFVGI